MNTNQKHGGHVDSLARRLRDMIPAEVWAEAVDGNDELAAWRAIATVLLEADAVPVPNAAMSDVDWEARCREAQRLCADEHIPRLLRLCRIEQVIECWRNIPTHEDTAKDLTDALCILDDIQDILKDAPKTTNDQRGGSKP